MPLNPSLLMQTAPFRGTPLPHCSSGRLRYSISFGNLIAAPTRRVVAPTLMWISSSYNLPYVGFSCAKPLNPSSLRYIGHSEESPLVELPAAVAVAAGFVYSGCGASTHLFVNTSPVKFTWNMHTLYRYLWGTIPFPVETNCPHRERQPPFYTTVGHVPVPGEFHEGRRVCGKRVALILRHGATGRSLVIHNQLRRSGLGAGVLSYRLKH